tara:strand:- start:309 stop:815 length:507 start_codon:yes stop_codon:yes gene_type:complete
MIPSNMRQRLRNPSGKDFWIVTAVVALILGAALTPIVINGVDRYKETKRIQARQFAPPPGAWVRPWLVRKAEIMIEADQPHLWHPTDFQFGPCFPDNIRQLLNDDFRTAIRYSCGEFHRIQDAYAINCATTNNCVVPEAAKDELRAVISVLDEAFEDAGFVERAIEEQ